METYMAVYSDSSYERSFTSEYIDRGMMNRFPWSLCRKECVNVSGGETFASPYTTAPFHAQ